MVNPTRPLLLLLYVLGILIVVALVFPKNQENKYSYEVFPVKTSEKGDTISDAFAIKFFDFSKLFVRDTSGEATDISDIVNRANKMKNIDKDKIHKNDSISVAVLDSNIIDSNLVIIDTVPNLDVSEIEKLLSAEDRIQFPKNTPHALHHFFQSLNYLKHDSSLIRILHYGDSQIEGDRISSHLRNNFQQQFGGKGVGIVPVFDAVGKSTIFRKKSPNWKNYLVFGPKYKKYNPNNYGMTGSYFTYTPIPRIDKKKTILPPTIKDSVRNDSMPLVTKKSIDTLVQNPLLNDSLLLVQMNQQELNQGWFQYSHGWKKYKQMIEAEQISLIYGNVYTDNFVQVTTKKDTLDKFIIHPSNGLHIKTFRLQDDFNKIRVHIKGRKSPQVYGMSFDGLKGVAVDNIGFRGSSGSEFVRMDMDLLAKQIKEMNTKLLILQFGVNVAAGRQLKSYSFYERIFDKQLKAIRRMIPDISILIVGLSDMAYIKDGKHISRPSIEKVRDIQKKVAFDNGCAFWDLYQAMGGKNSMVSWVESKPSLAKPDYTHFNSRGAELVGEMLYNALLLAYAKHNKIVE